VETPENSCLEPAAGPTRRRRWSLSEKQAIMEKTYEPGNSVSSVARAHGIAVSQLFNWLKAQQLRVVESAPVEPTELAAAERKIRQLQRLLERKSLEVEILREAVEVGRAKKLLSPSRSRARGNSR